MRTHAISFHHTIWHKCSFCQPCVRLREITPQWRPPYLPPSFFISTIQLHPHLKTHIHSLMSQWAHGCCHDNCGSWFILMEWAKWFTFDDWHVRGENRSDALSFANSRSVMNNLKRSKLGEISASEAQLWTEKSTRRVLQETRRNFHPFRWRGLAARSSAPGWADLRTRYRACDPFNPLIFNPPPLFDTTHLHNPHITLTYHSWPSPSTATTSPLE